MTDKEIIIDGVDVSGCKYCLKMTKYRCTIQRDIYINGYVRRTLTATTNNSNAKSKNAKN